MNRIALASAMLLVAGGSNALAASCVVNPSTPVYAFDDSAISIIFDSFFASPGDSAMCHLSMSATANTPADPNQFAVYSATYEGFVDSGETAHITVEHDGVTDEADVDGLKDVGDTFYKHYIGKDGDGNLVSDITLEQENGFGAVIDTLDYALAATMTRADAEVSLGQVGLGETALITHLDGMAGLLTGGNLALEGSDEFGVFGGIGSFEVGAHARRNLAAGFSLLGGASIVDLASTGGRATGVIASAALRYVDPNVQPFRLFGEAGLQAGALGLSFERTYTDSTGNHSVTGSGTGGVGAFYARGGVLWEPDAANEVLFSATIKESALGVRNYSEPFSTANLFTADLSGTTSLFTTAKAGVDWTTQLATDVDLTASAALGTTIQNAGTAAYIFGGGTTTGVAQSTIFAEYGLRLGWMPSATTTIDGFVQGTTGTGIGTHVQVGAGARMKF